MAPILDVAEEDFERANRILELAKVEYSVPHADKQDSGVIYVPSISLDVSKDREFQNSNWHEEHKQLHRRGERMLPIPEFVEFLKYAEINFPEIYKDITEVRSPWKAEWLDAYFEQRQDGMYVLTANRTKSEKLDEDTLMGDKQISLKSWLNNPTNQGLPRKNVEQGSLYYLSPRNKSVARFLASSDWTDLDCGWYPSGRGSGLGVRAAKQRE